MSESNIGEDLVAGSLDRADAHAEIKENKKYVLERIGHVPYAPGGPYSGCKMIRFERESNPVAAFNDFFEKNGNLLVVQTWVETGTITCLVTNQMNDAQMEVFNERADIVERMVKELMEEKEKNIKAQEAAIETEHARLQRLAKVGEHCEHNHGAVEKRLKAKAKKE